MPEKKPSLKIYREVVNAEELNFEELYSRIHEHVTEDNELNLKVQHVPYIAIISPGDLRGFFDKLGIDPAEQEVADLGDYIADSLPDSVDENIFIPTLPFGEYAPYEKHNLRHFTLGKDNIRAQQERDVTRNLVQTFYGKRVVAADTWVSWNYVSEVRVLRNTKPRVIEAVRFVLTHQAEFLPPLIEFGPTIVEDVIITRR